jgi:GT2 family glycosyltransferase
VKHCTVIVVTYNSAADLPAMLDSLPAAAPGLHLRILVVDNDSADDIGAAIAGRPEVELIRAGGNLGYAGGINCARRQLGITDAVAVLNPDLRLAPGCLTRLVAAALRSGGAVPRFVDGSGDTAPSLRREPSLPRVLGDGLFGAHWPGRPGWLSEMVWDADRYERMGPVAWGTGAVLVVSSRAAVALGDWDERFFLYSEETDYSRRLRAAGFRIAYVPEAQVHHRGAGSGTGPGLTALNEVSRVRYYRKYHSAVATAGYRLAVSLGQLLRLRRPGHQLALRALWSARYRATLPGPTYRTEPLRDKEFVG